MILVGCARRCRGFFNCCFHRRRRNKRQVVDLGTWDLVDLGIWDLGGGSGNLRGCCLCQSDMDDRCGNTLWENCRGVSTIDC